MNLNSHNPLNDSEEDILLSFPIQSQFYSNPYDVYPLLNFNTNANQFYLSSEAKEKLRSLKGECYIISVSGNPQIGKSSLLSLLVCLLKNYDADDSNAIEKIHFPQIYQIGDGDNSTTQWTDMCCISKNGKNFIFLDIEGDNDPSRKSIGVWIYTNLIQTALSVSHVHIYNYTKIPHETFFNYIDSIHKVVKQNKLHSDFETKHIFLRRDHSVRCGKTPSDDLEKMKKSFDGARLTNEGLDYSLNLITSPPQHIKERTDSSSCITFGGSLCENCQKDLFTTILLEIQNELKSHFQKVMPFKSGQDIIETLEKILNINAQDLPFFLDEGHIEKIRSDRLKKDRLRIQKGLLSVKQLQMERSLSREIQKIMGDHPKLAKTNISDHFLETQGNLFLRISQMEFLIPEITKFMKAFLFDENASILNEREKKILLKTYVFNFKKVAEDIIDSFQSFDALMDLICTDLEEFKQVTQTNFKAYMSASRDYKTKLAASFASFSVSAVAGIVGRDALLGLTAIAGTGGVVAIGLSIISFIQLKQKWDNIKREHDEVLDATRIPGISDEKEAQQALQKIDVFVTNLITSLRQNRETLREICLEKEELNEMLEKKIREALDNKMKGESLSADSQLEFLNIIKTASNNIEKFKQSLSNDDSEEFSFGL